MVAQDPFTQRYAPLLDETYDVVDRIVLNAYFGLGSSPGGFITWWRNVHGTTDNLDNTHLMRMAGRFSRRVRGWAEKHRIPVIYCKAGERKHEIAEQHIPTDPNFRGIFLVLVNRASTPVWNVLRFPSGGFHLKRKEPTPFINHYSFHIIDDEWGHVTIQVSGHPPFKARVMLNGHEYTACQARKAGVQFAKEGNCFTEVSNAAGLAKVADTLRSPIAVGRLRRVCERWIYKCLCFGLSFDEQKKSGFRYSYSVYQVEYSRNLLFHNGHKMDQVFHGMIDRTRAMLNINRVKTIFGLRNRPQKRRYGANRFEAVVERPEYDLTIFKLHYGRLTLKAYTKGECVLRTEAIVHNVVELRCGRIIDRFPDVVRKLAEMLERFLQTLRCVDQAWISDRTLETLPTPTLVGKTRVGGVDMNKPRTRAVMEAIIALAACPTGFTAAQHAGKVQEIVSKSGMTYTPRQSSYDLKKLRGKGLIEKTAPHGRHYAPTSDGLRAMAALFVLRDKVIKPLLSYNGRCKPGSKTENTAELDAQYQAVQRQMQHLFRYLRLAA
jgi:hypothetical protein